MTTASSGSTLLAGVSAFLTGAGTDERRHYRVLYGAVMIFFALFLGVPLALIFGQSILEKGTLTAANWLSVVMRPGFWSMMANSFAVSTAAAAVATLLGFFAAYGLVISQLPAWVKKAVRILMLLPLFLPSITYGFAVIYSFGRMGLISQFFGPPPFSIYCFLGTADC